MTKLNDEIRSELSIDELSTVAGGDWFFGMGCSQNTDDKIGSVVGTLGNIPVIGGALAAVATAVGRAICA